MAPAPRTSRCRTCGAEIILAVSSSGRRVAVDVAAELRIVLTAPPRDGDPPVAAKVQVHVPHVLSCTRTR